MIYPFNNSFFYNTLDGTSDFPLGIKFVPGCDLYAHWSSITAEHCTLTSKSDKKSSTGHSGRHLTWDKLCKLVQSSILGYPFCTSKFDLPKNKMTSTQSGPFSSESEDRCLNNNSGQPTHHVLPLSYTQLPPDSYQNLAVYPPRHSEPGHASIIPPITSQTHGVHSYYPKQLGAHVPPDSESSFLDSIKKQEYHGNDSQAALLFVDGTTKSKVREWV